MHDLHMDQALPPLAAERRPLHSLVTNITHLPPTPCQPRLCPLHPVVTILHTLISLPVPHIPNLSKDPRLLSQPHLPRVIHFLLLQQHLIPLQLKRGRQLPSLLLHQLRDRQISSPQRLQQDLLLVTRIPHLQPPSVPHLPAPRRDLPRPTPLPDRPYPTPQPQLLNHLQVTLIRRHRLPSLTLLVPPLRRIPLKNRIILLGLIGLQPLAGLHLDTLILSQAFLPSQQVPFLFPSHHQLHQRLEFYHPSLPLVSRHPDHFLRSRAHPQDSVVPLHPSQDLAATLTLKARHPFLSFQALLSPGPHHPGSHLLEVLLYRHCLTAPRLMRVLKNLRIMALYPVLHLQLLGHLLVIHTHHHQGLLIT